MYFFVMSSTMKILSVFLIAFLCLAQPCASQWASSATTQVDVEIIEPNPISCECSDVNPRDGVYYNVTYTCLQQYVFGSCNESFITDSVKELAEAICNSKFVGYCQVTCGRCSCCISVAETLKNINATAMLELVRVSGLFDQLNAPASMFTLLAPTNEAFNVALTTMGYANIREIPAEYAQILVKYHIVPPHPQIDATWTAPFFKASNNKNVATVLLNSPLSFKSSTNGILVNGASNSALILKEDIVACKSYIELIDGVLLPPSSAVALALPTNAGNITSVFNV